VTTRALDLSQLVHERTGGNPFFAIQFLTALTEEKLLTFDAGTGGWYWDLGSIRAKRYTDNVVDLIVGKLGRLPSETLEALKQFACLGNAADFGTLATVCGQSEEALHAALWDAVRAGPILRQSTTYAFLHDRVQEAAYELFPEARRKELHLKIGRLLLAQYPQDVLAERVFDIVDQFNRSVELVTDAEERVALRRINTVAARRARAAAAYASGRRYLAQAMGLLPADHWNECYVESLALFLELAECEYLVGNHQRADALLTAALETARSQLDRAKAYRLRLRLYQLSGRFPEALEAAFEALRFLGVTFPAVDEDARVATEAEFDLVPENLRGRRIEDLADIPLASDAETRTLIGLLADATPLVFLVRPDIWMFFTAKAVNICLQRGHGDESSHLYAAYAMALAGDIRNILTAQKFSEMAIELNARTPGAGPVRGVGLFLHSIAIIGWCKHFATSLPFLEQAFVKQTRLIGVLYLENDLATHAFTPDRLAILELLAAQAATSLENALAHEALQEREERLRLTLEATRIGTWDWDVEHDQWSASPTYYTMLGYEPTSGPGDRAAWVERLHPDDRALFARKMREVMAGSLADYEYEARMRHADGTYRWQHVQGFGIKRDQEGKATRMLGIRMDVTERKQAEEALLRYKNQLEESVHQRTVELLRARDAADAANRSKSAFLANMSHEIRTPMNAIIGLTHLLRRASPTPQQGERLEKIGVAANHLLSVINDILDLSKIEAGKLEIEQENFELSAVLDHVRSLFGDATQAKGVVIDVDPNGVPLWLRGDATRLRQALLNYVGNAVKFTEQGRILVRAILLDERGDELRVRFEVKDTGIGIAADKLPSLFRAFEQADTSTTRQYGGTGLGLAITKRLAVLMGGDAGVQSELGKGSTFWFSAVLHRGHGVMTASVERTEPAEAKLRREFGGSRLLLAEDDPINQEVALELLHAVGLAVDVARDGREAVEMAGRGAYDLILMDMQMPQMNGLDNDSSVARSRGNAHSGNDCQRIQ